MSLRPLRASEVLDTVFSLYGHNFGLLIGTIAVLQVPYQLLSFLVTATLLTKVPHLPAHTSKITAAQSHALVHYLVSLLVVGLILAALNALAVIPLQAAAFTRVVAERFLGRVATVGEAYRFAFRRWLPLLGVSILVGLILVGSIAVSAGVLAGVALAVGKGALLLDVVVGIAALILIAIVAVRLVVAVPALVLEGCSPVEALRRSWGLTANRVGHGLGIVLLLWVMQVAVGGLLGLLLGLVESGLHGASLQAASFVGGLVIALLIAPIFGVGIVVLYFDFRVAKEQLTPAQIAGQPPG